MNKAELNKITKRSLKTDEKNSTLKIIKFLCVCDSAHRHRPMAVRNNSGFISYMKHEVFVIKRYFFSTLIFTPCGVLSKSNHANTAIETACGKSTWRRCRN